MSKWTKLEAGIVNNTLPRFGQTVIVSGTLKGKRFVGAAYLHSLSKSGFYWVVLLAGSWNAKVKVEAWMPLPPAPK